MEREKRSLVSILIPCYNHEKYVGDCLQSILAQDYPEYEVIICDDCSKDASMEVIRQQEKDFQKKGISMTVMANKENQGLIRNLNRMLKEAKGEYIKIIASDDIFCENYLREMVAVLEKDKDAKFAFSNAIRVKEETTYPVQKQHEIAPLMEKLPDYKENVLERIFVDNFIPAPTTLFRRSVFEELGDYDENIGIEDLEMSLRVLQRYPNGVTASEKCLVYYRVNDNSMSSVANNAGAKRRMKFMLKNSVAIAKKYKKAVSGKTYRIRMTNLYLIYWMQRKDMMFQKKQK